MYNFHYNKRNEQEISKEQKEKQREDTEIEEE
jgi:hypothetical protein